MEIAVKKGQFVNELQDKTPVSASFVVKYSAVAVGKNGKPYMNLTLADRSGEVEARVWDSVEEIAGQAVKDAFVLVEGKCQLFQGRKQVVVSKLRVLREDEVEPKDFVAESKLDPEVLYAKAVAFIATMKDPYYRALAESIFVDDAEVIARFKRAPAAKSVHHAYRSGLIEHVVSILGILDGLSSHYGSLLDRDLLFLGGLLHDIGKIWELSYERTTDYTDEGRLIGHLVMGVELIERKVRELEAQPGRLPGAFPRDKVLLTKHLVLAHHGKLEFGSPKEPHCLEALVVHMVDDLDSKVGAISGFIAQDQTPGRWTALHRMYSRYFYKPDQPQSSNALGE
jgi:3'-5' exoribonuclease